TLIFSFFVAETRLRSSQRPSKRHGNARGIAEGSLAAQCFWTATDRVPERDNRIAPLAQAHGLLLIWQRPSHEALLLRHLPGCQTLRPSSSAAATDSLVRQWPEYRKPMSARRLAERLGLSEIQVAASVEVDLRAFLSSLGIPIA
ncbi:MAG TPA: hypothetical protein VF207_04220, partial [Chthoniobacterales bacterium]